LNEPAFTIDALDVVCSERSPPPPSTRSTVRTVPRATSQELRDYRAAKCWQIYPFQWAHEYASGRGGELSILHYRAQQCHRRYRPNNPDNVHDPKVSLLPLMHLIFLIPSRIPSNPNVMYQ
jgi:hypothetical protein